MRTPVGIVNFSFFLAVLGVLGVAAAYWYGDGSNVIMGFTGLFGATLIILGLGMGLSYIGEVRTYRRLKRGEGILAQWSVSPEQWNAFVTLNRALNEIPGRYFRLSAAERDLKPVDVVIGEKGLILNGTFHALSKSGARLTFGPFWMEGPPAYLEYGVNATVDDSGGVTTTSIRVPIAPGADLRVLRISNLPAAGS
jgi:hypothetical protein